MSNPFLYGNPVPPERFIGRHQERGKIARRLAHQGQSTAIIGEPRIGKTSLLEYFFSPTGRDGIQRLTSAQLLFSYLDAHAWPSLIDLASFWSQALDPLQTVTHSLVADAYRLCQASGFDIRPIERLLAAMNSANLRLIVLLDEFDHLVGHRVKAPAAFFGALRSLASRSRGSLALVLASRTPIAVLDDMAQGQGYSGSPFFNFVSEVRLGPLPDAEVEELLACAKDRFSPEECRQLQELSGAHPYLLQVAAEALWTAYESGESDTAARRQLAGTALLGEAARMFADIWKQWPPATRLVCATIAIEQMGTLSEFASALTGASGASSPLADVGAFSPELDYLCAQGLIVREAGLAVGWRIRPVAFLAWCAMEFRRQSASPWQWVHWLREQGWEGYLSPPQHRLWVDGVRASLVGASIHPEMLLATLNAMTSTAHRPMPNPVATSPAIIQTAPAPVPQARRPVRLFCSHAEQDHVLCAQLKAHLSPLRRVGLLEEVCCREQIEGGRDWRNTIEQYIRRADVVVPLISHIFIDAEHAYDVELALALEQRKQRKTEIVPVMVRPVDIRGLPLAELQMLPADGRAVTLWPHQDEAWRDVAAGIRRVIERLALKPA